MGPFSESLPPEDAAYLADISASYADWYEISDPPLVDIVRWVATEDADAARWSCLESKGFVRSDDPSFTVPPPQKESFDLAQYECTMSYPILRAYSGEWGREQIEAQYRWTVEFLVPCLEGEGFAIVNIPSRETFVDTWSAAPFYPFAQVVPLLNGPSAELEQTCPQIAPSAVLWEGEPVPEYSFSG